MSQSRDPATVRRAVLLAAATFGLIHTAAQAQNAPVTVYSSRIEQLIKPIFDECTKQTGIKINL